MGILARTYGLTVACEKLRLCYKKLKEKTNNKTIYLGGGRGGGGGNKCMVLRAL